MENKIASTILGCIIASFLVLFATAGGMYLLGNILIGWSWLTFDICVGITGALILIALMIVICILERKERL